MSNIIYTDDQHKQSLQFLNELADIRNFQLAELEIRIETERYSLMYLSTYSKIKRTTEELAHLNLLIAHLSRLTK